MPWVWFDWIVACGLVGYWVLWMWVGGLWPMGQCCGLLIRGLLRCVGVIAMGVIGGLRRGCGWVDGSRHGLWFDCSVSEKGETKRKRGKEIEMMMNKK